MIRNATLGVVNLIGRGAVLAIVVYLLIYGYNVAFSTGYELLAESPTKTDKIVDVKVTIPQGSSTEEIATILEDNGLIGSSFYFRVLAKFYGHDGSFQYGDYTLSTSMSEDEMMKVMMTEGYKRETVSFTIPEGYTIDQIAKKLDSEGIVSSGDFLDAVYDADYGYDFIEDIPDRNLRLQGYLFPDTYEIYTDATAEQIVSIMLKRFNQVFTQDFRDRADSLGMSIDEVLTVASIIEREAKVADERKIISGVIYNRLDINMKLEMCSTVMYVLDKPQDRLLYSDLKIDSPYNTYMYAGLPVGPIANPGEASIVAALYPDQHDYYFFVLKNEETGEHAFTRTLDEHNAAKYTYDTEF